MRSRTCQISKEELHDPQHPVRRWLGRGVDCAGSKRLTPASDGKRGVQIATPGVVGAKHVEEAEFIIGIIELLSELERSRKPPVGLLGYPYRKSSQQYLKFSIKRFWLSFSVG